MRPALVDKQRGSSQREDVLCSAHRAWFLHPWHTNLGCFALLMVQLNKLPKHCKVPEWDSHDYCLLAAQQACVVEALCYQVELEALPSMSCCCVEKSMRTMLVQEAVRLQPPQHLQPARLLSWPCRAFHPKSRQQYCSPCINCHSFLQTVYDIVHEYVAQSTLFAVQSCWHVFPTGLLTAGRLHRARM